MGFELLSFYSLSMNSEAIWVLTPPPRRKERGYQLIGARSMVGGEPR